MKKSLVVVLATLLLFLVSCTPAEKVEILGVDFGIAEVLAGDTFVIVTHNLGVVPSDIQLTLVHNPNASIVYWTKNPTAEVFSIEMSGVSAINVHFYWRVEK